MRYTLFGRNCVTNSQLVSPNEIYETKSRGFDFYLEMARLTLKEPEALMPVKGVRIRQITNIQGIERSNGRWHSGLDIFAKRCTPVYSASFAYWRKQFGC